MVFRRHHRFMWTFTKSLLASFKRPVFVYLITLSLTTVFLCSVMIFFFERDLNPKVKTLFDAFYYSITITTGVGLGDIVPITVLGRVLSMLMMLLGTAIFVSFTAVLAVTVLEVELEHNTNKRSKSD